MKKLNESILDDYGLSIGTIVPLHNIVIRSVKDKNDLNGDWKSDPEEERPCIIVDPLNAVDEDAFAYIITHFNGEDLEKYKNDYNAYIKPHKSTNGLNFLSLVQCFQLIRITPDNLPKNVQEMNLKRVTKDAVNYYNELLYKFADEHPEIDFINEELDHPNNIFSTLIHETNYDAKITVYDEDVIDDPEELKLIDPNEDWYAGDIIIRFDDGFVFIGRYSYEINSGYIHAEEVSGNKITARLLNNGDIKQISKAYADIDKYKNDCCEAILKGLDKYSQTI